MTLQKVTALAGLLAILALVNHAIWQKEQHLENGRRVFMELAPVDPRSLMQGDYMALRFEVANQLRDALPKEDGRRWWRKVDANDGWVKLVVDEQGVGRFAGVVDQPDAAPGAVHVAFRVRSGTVKFATNAYFFQEGTADVYEAARYGEFRLNDRGEPLLVALRDEQLAQLGPPEATE